MRGLEGIKTTIVSNRLPIKLSREDDHWKLVPGSGGLITALAPVLKNHGGTWIGWPGAPLNYEINQLIQDSTDDIGFDLQTIDLTEDEVAGYYRGFSNEAVWPLYHDLLDHCNFDLSFWETYQKVNYKFAHAVTEKSPTDNFIWIQDYQLQLVGHFLKEMGFANTAFFLHIPFPPKDIYIKMPWRKEILQGLLSYRLLGFQTERDRRNFIYCVRYLLPEAHISHHRKYPFIKYNNHTCRIGSYPISIDFVGLNEFVNSKEVADAGWLFHEKYPDQKIMIGVDRLDYTKGIPHRLLAYENCLERYPELRGKIVFVQLVVPSRTEVSEYQMLKKQIDEMIGRINGRFTRQGWVPIHYIYGTLKTADLFGWYRASEIALITPLKDGMNLVSKEYCAACIEDKGVLILSEFAGSADELGQGAILVNPYNLEEVADAIFSAFYLDTEDQKNRMSRMRSIIYKNHIFKWVDQFIGSFFFEESES